MQNLADIRCPAQTYSIKYKKNLTCNNLIVKVAPGSSGQGWCYKKDERSNIRHGEFYFEIDESYIPPEPKTIRVQKT